MGPVDQLTPAAAARPAGHGRLMVNLVAQLAFGLLAMTICLPSMQDWPATFSASQAAVQLTFSGYVAAYGGLQLVYGAVSDRIGRRPVLLFGLVLAVAGSLLAAVASDLPLLVAGRVVQGAGAAAGMVTVRAMVQDLFTGAERTRMMAFIGMSMGVCPPVATLLGGQLHVRLGWQANFVLMAVVAAVLLAAAWLGVPSTTQPARPHDGAWRALVAGYGRLVREPAFLLYVAILASMTATFYAFLGGAPIVLKSYGVTPERVGWYIMCVPLAYIGGNLLTTRLVRWVRDRTLMRLGQASTIGGISLVLLLGLGGWGSPLTLALPLLLLGIGHGLLAPPTLAGTVGVVPALAGSAAAVGGLVQQLVGGLAALGVGMVSHDGQVALAAMMLGWTALGLAAQALLRHPARRT
ncbi:MAG TPA: MFS transporter [Ramlibacter sp.]|jgi:DHA1 family bicyclomycin/chloramphenicol resistance-like MFS transporter|uniref:MFS transporter n=1 Tax=Ramlibacter sp. TaxID=1917967 RepID=UPI002D4D6609|nr:MFS transporter [Ramlibacter sp.]HZY18430.1 MFS transporter [Ramlibacter sp.]